jgi:hypothetical protein
MPEMFLQHWYCGKRKAWEDDGRPPESTGISGMTYKQNPNFILALMDLGSVYGKNGAGQMML